MGDRSGKARRWMRSGWCPPESTAAVYHQSDFLVLGCSPHPVVSSSSGASGWSVLLVVSEPVRVRRACRHSPGEPGPGRFLSADQVMARGTRSMRSPVMYSRFPVIPRRVMLEIWAMPRRDSSFSSFARRCSARRASVREGELRADHHDRWASA